MKKSQKREKRKNKKEKKEKPYIIPTSHVQRSFSKEGRGCILQPKVRSTHSRQTGELSNSIPFML